MNGIIGIFVVQSVAVIHQLSCIIKSLEPLSRREWMPKGQRFF
jgi:hypothetical protein